MLSPSNSRGYMKTFHDYGIDVQSKTSGEAKTICPQCSHLRTKKTYPCLNVNIDKKIWNCWHCGWSGGLFQGILNEPLVAHKRIFSQPDHHPQPLADKHLNFLIKRGLTIDVILRNQIAVEQIWMPQIEEESLCIAMPYIRNGIIVNIKYRDGQKNFRQVAGAEKILYKWDDINDEETIITEGEIDALSFEVAGYKNAISVPDGAPSANSKTFETKFSFLNDDRLDSVRKFIICVDSDDPGKRLEEELCRRLGRERCFKTILPADCKDANEVLMKHGVNKLKECITDSKAYPVEGVISVYDIEDDLNRLLLNGMDKGEPTGWSDVDRLYTPAAGQWTLITGIPSMGKSEWLDALAINIAEQAGWVFGICSPENQPIAWHVAKLLEKKIEKRLVPGAISDKEFSEAKQWMHEHFHFILPEKPTLASVLDKAKILVRRHGLKGLIIDPYNELDHVQRQVGINETEYVSSFLSELRMFARTQSVHIWLVAHPAKLFKEKDGTYPVPDGYSVSGSAHFYNKADNIISIHRDISVVGSCTEVHVQKVRSRWLGERGMARLKWRKECGRYSDFIETHNRFNTPMKNWTDNGN